MTAFGPETGLDSTTGWRDLLPKDLFAAVHRISAPTDNTLSFVKLLRKKSAEWEGRAEGRGLHGV